MLRIWVVAIVIMAGLAGFVFSFDQAYRKVVGIMHKSDAPAVAADIGTSGPR